MKIARVIVCLMTLAAAAVWAKSAAGYDLRINNPAMVAGTELQAGDYRVEIVGDKAMIHGKSNTVEASIKVEDGDQKFSATTVRYSIIAGGKYRIDEIHLGGTRMKVVFNN